MQLLMNVMALAIVLGAIMKVEVAGWCKCFWIINKLKHSRLWLCGPSNIKESEADMIVMIDEG